MPGDPACDARHLAEFRPEITRDSPALPQPGGRPPRHAGYHYIGPYTDYPAIFGIYTGRRVSNPAVSGQDNFYATMHACNNSPPYCDRWGEVGWYKAGTDRGIFTYSTDNGFHDYKSVYPISTGQLLTMQISWNGVVSNPLWWVYLWWNNQWNRIDLFSFGRPNAGRSDLVYEMINDDATHLTFPDTWVEGTVLESCLPNCYWYNWDDTVPMTGVFTAWGYGAHFYNYYYKWYGHSH